MKKSLGFFWGIDDMAFCVGDLLLLLKNVDPKTPIVIDNVQVHGFWLENGRTKSEYMNDGWLPLERGNKKAVRFTKLVELSDGTIEEICF